MKTKLSFTITSLLYGFDNPKGSIENVLFAKKVAKHEGFEFFNRIANVAFDDCTINKAMPGSMPLYETILLAYEFGGDITLHLCIKGEKSTCRIATGSFKDKSVNIHNEYNHAMLLNKLSDIEINKIFNHVWDNIEIIQPIPRILED
ncbi:hypothetical protein [Sphingobacterium sp. R2]|uniref:hypothetical protein n=1 Tax=Sphingobacterium sp. R2 TaxID=3112958 RepID=UPI00345DAA16